MTATVENKLVLEFVPHPNKETDEIKITMSKDVVAFLKRVSLKRCTDTLFCDNPIQRHCLKKFVTSNYSYFNFLWAKELMEKGEMTLKGNYSQYVEIINKIRQHRFKNMCREIANYKREKFTVDMGNVTTTNSQPSRRLTIADVAEEERSRQAVQEFGVRLGVEQHTSQVMEVLENISTDENSETDIPF